MFVVDSLPSAYCNERTAADEERRRAQVAADMSRALQQGGVASDKSQRPSAQLAHQHQHHQSAGVLSHALLHQRPPLNRPMSAGFLGNIFQGIAKAATSPPGTPSLRTPSPSNQRQVNDTSAAEAVAAKLLLEKRKQQELDDERRKQDYTVFMGRA